MQDIKGAGFGTFFVKKYLEIEKKSAIVGRI